jgi:hypothetical protein
MEGSIFGLNLSIILTFTKGLRKTMKSPSGWLVSGRYSKQELIEHESTHYHYADQFD